MAPVVHGRKRLAGKPRVRHGFVPTDAAHRPVVLAFRIRPELPGRWTRSAGGVAELGHGLVPRDRAAVFHKRLRPELRRAVAAGIDKALVGPIGDLEVVDEEVRQAARLRDRAARHRHHAVGRGALRRSVNATSPITFGATPLPSNVSNPGLLIRQRNAPIVPRVSMGDCPRGIHSASGSPYPLTKTSALGDSVGTRTGRNDSVRSVWKSGWRVIAAGAVCSVGKPRRTGPVSDQSPNFGDDSADVARSLAVSRRSHAVAPRAMATMTAAATSVRGLNRGRVASGNGAARCVTSPVPVRAASSARTRSRAE